MHVLVNVRVKIEPQVVLLITGRRFFVVPVLVLVTQRSQIFYVFCPPAQLHIVPRLGRPILKRSGVPIRVGVSPGVGAVFIFSDRLRREGCVAHLPVGPGKRARRLVGLGRIGPFIDGKFINVQIVDHSHVLSRVGQFGYNRRLRKTLIEGVRKLGFTRLAALGCNQDNAVGCPCAVNGRCGVFQHGDTLYVSRVNAVEPTGPGRYTINNDECLVVIKRVGTPDPDG